MSNKKRKSIILGLPKSFEVYNYMERNLDCLGFDVINIAYNDHEFKYRNVWQRIHNFLRKILFKDRHFKNRLKFKQYKNDVVQKINDYPTKVDYALIIRADIYPLEVIQLIKRKTQRMVAYQWDGLDRFPAIYSHLREFERFFVFQPKDLDYSKKKLLPLTNFYFDLDKEQIEDERCDNDVFYVGSFSNKRINVIQEFLELFREINFKTDFFIYFNREMDRQQYASSLIQTLDKHMTYEENIKRLKNARVVIDFLNDTHKGLSFRIFEALYYNKKLITNNSMVKNYDFYHPNNCFVFKDERINKNELIDFIHSPYTPVKPEIKAKYGFKNWIHYVLDIPPYQAIKLPLKEEF